MGDKIFQIGKNDICYNISEITSSSFDYVLKTEKTSSVYVVGLILTLKIANSEILIYELKPTRIKGAKGLIAFIQILTNVSSFLVEIIKVGKIYNNHSFTLSIEKAAEAFTTLNEILEEFS